MDTYAAQIWRSSLLLAIPLVAAATAAAQPIQTAVVGQPAPALKLRALLNTPAGTPEAAQLDWNDLRGQLVVLEFWATTFGPCLASAPHLNELACAFEGQPVRFISIANQDERTVAAFLSGHTIAGWVGLDADGATFESFGVRSMPQTVVVDPAGTVIGIMMPEELTADVIRSALAGRTPRLPDGRGRHSVRAGIDPDAGAAAAKPLYQMVLRPSDRQIPIISRRPGAVTAEGATLAQLVALAWPGHHNPVIVPAGLDSGRYTLIASVPRGDDAELSAALRRTLRSTFAIDVRPEEREVEAVVLTLPRGRGPGLKDTEGGQAIMTSGVGHFAITNQPARVVASLVGAEFHRPTIDDTALGDAPCDLECIWDANDPSAKLRALLSASGIVATPERRTMELLTVTRQAQAGAGDDPS